MTVFDLYLMLEDLPKDMEVAICVKERVTMCGDELDCDLIAKVRKPTDDELEKSYDVKNKEYLVIGPVWAYDN